MECIIIITYNYYYSLLIKNNTPSGSPLGAETLYNLYNLF